MCHNHWSPGILGLASCNYSSPWAYSLCSAKEAIAMGSPCTIMKKSSHSPRKATKNSAAKKINQSIKLHKKIKCRFYVTAGGGYVKSGAAWPSCLVRLCARGVGAVKSRWPGRLWPGPEAGGIQAAAAGAVGRVLAPGAGRARAATRWSVGSGRAERWRWVAWPTRVPIPSPTPKSSFLMTCFDPRAFSPFPIFLRRHQTLSTPSPCFLLGVLFGVTLTVLGNFQNSEQMPTRRAKLERAAGIMEQRTDSPCWGRD